MKKLLLMFSLLLFASSTSLFANETLKEFTYENMNNIYFSKSKEDKASVKIDKSVMTPDNEKCLKISLVKISDANKAESVQLRYVYATGNTVKAGKKYKISFYCKSSKVGTLFYSIALAEQPGTSIEGTNCKVNINAKWNKYEVAFTAQKDFTVKLCAPQFMLGKFTFPADIYIGPIKIVEEN